MKREGRCDEIVRHDRVVERTLRQPVHVRVLLILEGELTVLYMLIQMTVDVSVRDRERELRYQSHHQAENVGVRLIHLQRLRRIGRSAYDPFVVGDALYRRPLSDRGRRPRRYYLEHDEISDRAKDLATIDARFRSFFDPFALKFALCAFAEQPKGTRTHVGGLFRFIRSIADTY